MKIHLPYHLGSGNRGCEGIARGISNIFQLSKQDLVLYDTSNYDVESDIRLELDKVGTLYFERKGIFELFRKLYRVLDKLGISKPIVSLMSSYYVNNVEKEDVIFITGGDIYCYEGAYALLNEIVKKAKKRGIKTVLYGASIDSKYFNDELLTGLKMYDQIVLRESLSKESLDNYGINSVLFPDPAFSLDFSVCEIPDYMTRGKVIGINFSDFTNGNELFYQNMDLLVEKVLSEGKTVCLFPHVFWKGQDDRTVLKEYVSKYAGKNVYVVDSEKLSYLEIRYLISLCECFIGGRTHSVISAYCMHVPCVALGYSIKSRGLVKDLGLPSYTLVDSKSLKTSHELLDAYNAVINNKSQILECYNFIDEYRKNAYRAYDFIKDWYDAPEK